MNCLKDALYYLNPDSGVSVDHARGMLVGVMAAVVHMKGCTFSEAADIVRPFLPEQVNPACMPPGWEPHFIKGAK